MTLNSNLIRELREKSGAGIVDCKNALNENDNDIEKSIDWLRKKGLSLAAKKSSRVASEGLIGCCINKNKGCILEVNTETDFVSRNELFQKFVKKCSSIATEVDGGIEELLQSKFLDNDNTVREELTNNVATIGENITIRRIKKIELNEKGLIASYVHNAVNEDLGKIAVLVSLRSNGDLKKLKEIGKKIAMHIAATNPLSISIESLDKNIIENEKQVLLEQAMTSGKPKEIAEKMVEGRLKKFQQDVVLLEQNFVIDGKTKIRDVLDNFSKEIGASIILDDFKMLILGEGIEVEEKDFAAEVAATIKN